MRKLQTRDVFNALRLIKKAELKEEIKPVVKLAADGDLKIEDIGIEGILTCIEIFTEKKAESAIYDFLAGPLEKDAGDVEKMELMELVEGLKQISEENDLKAFFTILSGMITKK